MTAKRAKPRGFSLVELVASLVVISVISAVLAPVLNSAADAIVTARDLRRASDDAGFAMATVTRVLREIPPGDGVNLALSSADATSIVFEDGRGVRLSDSTLEMLTPAGPAPLARQVTAFEIVYLGSDGRTPSAPAEAQRLHITMTVRGMTLGGVVFPRVNAGQSQSGGDG
jgi:prepilin-type N-terminal cleavage/methylation domain-containing protein